MILYQEGHKFVEAFLKTMPFLEASFKEHQKSVLGLLKDLQSSTRQVLQQTTTLLTVLKLLSVTS
jgi:Fanconi anaemia protein FancD2 nuclease